MPNISSIIRTDERGLINMFNIFMEKKAAAPHQEKIKISLNNLRLFESSQSHNFYCFRPKEAHKSKVMFMLWTFYCIRPLWSSQTQSYCQDMSNGRRERPNIPQRKQQHPPKPLIQTTHYSLHLPYSENNQKVHEKFVFTR